MNMDNELDIIKIKKEKLRYYRVFDLFLRSVLTLIGTVSLVSVLMFLNSSFSVSYFKCLMMSFFLPSIYSFIANSMLEGFDRKIKKMKFEVKTLEDGFKNEKELSKDSIIKDIEIRFEGLSSDKKKELLNYVKDRISENSCYDYISKLEDNDSVSLSCGKELLEKEDVLTKKRLNS